MDRNQLAAALIQAIAWPAVALIAVLLLRGHLSRIIDLVRAVRFRGLEFELEHEVASLRQEVRAAPPSSSSSEPYPPKLPQALISLAAISPRSTILEAWKEVQHALTSAASPQGIAVPPGLQIDYLGIARQLNERGFFSDASVPSLLPRMQRLVTALTSDPEKSIPAGIALEVADISLQIAAIIRASSGAAEQLAAADPAGVRKVGA